MNPLMDTIKQIALHAAQAITETIKAMEYWTIVAGSSNGQLTGIVLDWLQAIR